MVSEWELSSVLLAGIQTGRFRGMSCPSATCYCQQVLSAILNPKRRSALFRKMGTGFANGIRHLFFKSIFLRLTDAT